VVESEDDAAPSEAGGGESSARAVAMNAEAQRKAAMRAAVHPRIPGDRCPSQGGSWVLRTTTQLPSSTLSSRWPAFALDLGVIVLDTETQARNAG
jgi:hypothetical protein